MLLSSTTRIRNRRSVLSEPRDVFNRVPPVPTFIVDTEDSSSRDFGGLPAGANLNEDGTSLTVVERRDKTGRFGRFRRASSELRLNIFELEGFFSI